MEPEKRRFFIFIYDPENNSLWQISHKQILDDLTEKAKQDPDATFELLEALHRTYLGEEPNDFIESLTTTKLGGESPDALIKADKWIWSQEDVNYPTGIGREMSWEGLDELLQTLKGKVVKQ